jgi:predicted flap endonuclease-1-like 5' DNA nuclease
MRAALVRGDWDATGRAIAEEWDNRKRLAPGVTTPLHRGAHRARRRRLEPPPPRVCGAGGRRLSLLLRPARGGRGIRGRARRRRRPADRLHLRAPRAHPWITPRSRRCFGEIADLLEIKGENAFKIRAYRSAADTIAATGEAIARMTDAQLRGIPGIGKDLAAKIRELTDTGASAYHRGLLAEFPPTMLDLLRLQGVGPKTVARLHATLGVTSLDELAAAARAGRIRAMPGMGIKKEAQILKAVEDRQRDEGRHLLADTGRGVRRAARPLAVARRRRRVHPGWQPAPRAATPAATSTCCASAATARR